MKRGTASSSTSQFEVEPSLTSIMAMLKSIQSVYGLELDSHSTAGVMWLPYDLTKLKKAHSPSRGRNPSKFNDLVCMVSS